MDGVVVVTRRCGVVLGLVGVVWVLLWGCFGWLRHAVEVLCCLGFCVVGCGFGVGGVGFSFAAAHGLPGFSWCGWWVCGGGLRTQ
ncbi:hypothetical protein BIFGAL_03986 [Bifidobacterium gallicum DSM 20093 = LMG 11596]|uniref:Transmembrane protein n=1 Tax=Bifidobacterium gallicum DSM 20093 = LMG 11596 TaxID=561180 RepID=D1NVU3_9BIFI|nr:hypothetical protein BIFGAL_03986 [Bifidobacterium gallicum DSM 20093 = LMG 11596]